jgi:hypothetical protein
LVKTIAKWKPKGKATCRLYIQSSMEHKKCHVGRGRQESPPWHLSLVTLSPEPIF